MRAYLWVFFSVFVTVFTAVLHFCVTGDYGNLVCVNKNNCSSLFLCLVGLKLHNLLTNSVF